MALYAHLAPCSGFFSGSLKTSGAKADLRVAMPVPCMRAKLARPGAGACSAWLFVSQRGV